MRTAISLATLLVIALALVGCGTNSSSPLSGAWSGTLNNPDGTVAYTFTTNITQSSNGTLSLPGLKFTSVGACGALALVGGSGTESKQSVLITISSGLAQPEATEAVLSGTMSSNKITGTWTLIGAIAPCNGNGTFTMIQPMAGG